VQIDKHPWGHIELKNEDAMMIVMMMKDKWREKAVVKQRSRLNLIKLQRNGASRYEKQSGAWKRGHKKIACVKGLQSWKVELFKVSEWKKSGRSSGRHEKDKRAAEPLMMAIRNESVASWPETNLGEVNKGEEGLHLIKWPVIGGQSQLKLKRKPESAAKGEWAKVSHNRITVE
jgi:hypothetical protein